MTGAVRVLGSLEEIAGTSVKFSVWATDRGEPRRECISPATVIISVKSVKAALAAFPQTQLNTTLYLPTFPGVQVLCLEWGQGTTHITKSLKYSITKGDDTDRFECDGESRCVIIHDHLNLRSHYNLTLGAVDTSTMVSTSASAKITVEDAPLSTIVFTQEKYWAKVMENSTKKVNVVAVGVKGQPLNHHVQYSILNPSDKFIIHPTSGVIKTTGKPFDREAQDHYTLVVQVSLLEGNPGSCLCGGCSQSFLNLYLLLYYRVYRRTVLISLGFVHVFICLSVFISVVVSTTATRGHILTKVSQAELATFNLHPQFVSEGFAAAGHMANWTVNVSEK